MYKALNEVLHPSHAPEDFQPGQTEYEHELGQAAELVQHIDEHVGRRQ